MENQKASSDMIQLIGNTQIRLMSRKELAQCLKYLQQLQTLRDTGAEWEKLALQIYSYIIGRQHLVSAQHSYETLVSLAPTIVDHYSYLQKDI